MASKKIITVFGATGNQGSSVIDTVFAHPDISAKYQLRGVTRSKNGPKAQTLATRGVEMVEANLFDPPSIKAAVEGSYGVYINTDYWTLLDKDKEIEQGKNIFQACKEANVHHVVVSTLPHVSKLSNGKYTGVAHFDSKAIVGEFVEANKGSMVVSYFLPAMYMENIKMSAQEHDGTVLISLPYPDINAPWPMISPSRDTGKYVVGLFEGGNAADGVAVQGVSAWTTPNEVARILGDHTGKNTKFNSISKETYEQYLPEKVREELSEMMQWIGEASYYGKGSEKKQAASDKWLVKGETLTSWEDFVRLEF
jgi:hypothetical protein